MKSWIHRTAEKCRSLNTLTNHSFSLQEIAVASLLLTTLAQIVLSGARPLPQMAGDARTRVYAADVACSSGYCTYYPTPRTSASQISGDRFASGAGNVTADRIGIAVSCLPGEQIQGASAVGVGGEKSLSERVDAAANAAICEGPSQNRSSASQLRCQAICRSL